MSNYSYYKQVYMHQITNTLLNMVNKKTEVINMEQVKISFYVEKSLRTKLNVIAAKNDTTVRAILTELIEQYINENE